MATLRTTTGGKLLKVGDKLSTGENCCCPTSCGATLTCQQKSGVKVKCGFTPLAGSDVATIGCDDVGEDEPTWVAAGDAVDSTNIYLTRALTALPCPDVGFSGAINLSETRDPATMFCDTTLTGAGSITDDGDSSVYDDFSDGFDSVVSASEDHMSISAELTDLYTNEMLVANLIAALPGYADGTCHAALVFGTFNDGVFTGAGAMLTALEYTIITSVPVSWDVVFTPLVGSPTTTHMTTNTGETHDIVPDGTVEGTWDIRNFRCVV